MKLVSISPGRFVEVSQEVSEKAELAIRDGLTSDQVARLAKWESRLSATVFAGAMKNGRSGKASVVGHAKRASGPEVEVLVKFSSKLKARSGGLPVEMALTNPKKVT
jgi:hypothetical protein